MKEKLKKLRKLEEQCREILAAAGDGPLTEEQRTKYDGLKAEMDGLVDAIQRERDLEPTSRILDAPADKPEAPVLDGESREKPGDAEAGGRKVSGVHDREAAKPFGSVGEQLRAVAAAAYDGAVPDKRLLHIHEEVRAATGMSEAIPADGGFLVQKDFAAELIKKAFNVGEILKRVRRRPLSENSNGLKLNKLKENSRADGSRYGGVRAYWLAEAQQKIASQLEFERIELELHKVAALLYATDELLADAVALTAEINDVVPEEIRFTVEDAIINGNGVGKPLGILNGGSMVTVAKEAAQAADTVVAANATKMWARIWPGSFMNSVWLVDQSVLAQLPLMTIGDQPVWTPPGMLKDTPNGALLGRPIVPVEYLTQLGTLNDMLLVDLNQYLFIDKGGIESATSIHVRFIYDETAFRFVYRCDGQPLWDTVVTPKSGGDTIAPFINLAERA